MRAGAALLFIGLVLMALAWMKEPRATSLIEDTTRSNVHHADYQRCIRVDPGPLKPPPQCLNGRGHVSEIA